MNLRITLRAISHRLTWFVGTRFPNAVPLVFVVGYPKSGTTWACQLIAECLELPFPRFSIFPVGCPAVVHGHDLVSRRYPRCAYVVRDGRDVIVSHYFYLSRPIPDGDNPPLTRRQRRNFPGLLNKARVRENLPRFIEAQVRRPDSSPANWADHVRSALTHRGRNFALLRYEDLLEDGPRALSTTIAALNDGEADPEKVARALDKYSFRRQSGRTSGQEDRSSFLRSGRSGDWRNHFTPEAARIFDEAFGEVLVEAGYESSRDWVASVSDERE